MEWPATEPTDHDGAVVAILLYIKYITDVFTPFLVKIKEDEEYLEDKEEDEEEEDDDDDEIGARLSGLDSMGPCIGDVVRILGAGKLITDEVVENMEDMWTYMNNPMY
jgi:hypothetical protein